MPTRNTSKKEEQQLREIIKHLKEQNRMLGQLYKKNVNQNLTESSTKGTSKYKNLMISYPHMYNNNANSDRNCRKI